MIDRVVFLCFAVVCLSLLYPAATRAQDPAPALTGRVVDLAEILSPATEETLTTLLAAYEDSTSNQVAVLTVPSLGGEAIETYALRVAETWALGTAERDNGVLFVVAVEDRSLRIEVGYGLEGILPDVVASRIIREQIVPYFREGAYERGVEMGVLAVVAALEHTAEPAEMLDIVADEPKPAPEASEAFGLDAWQVLALFFYLALLLLAGVAALLAAMEKKSQRALLFAFILICFFFTGRSLGYFVFWVVPPWLLAVGFAGLFAACFWMLAQRLDRDPALKTTWQRRLLIHGPDPETPAEKGTAPEEETAASPYPRRLQVVVLVAFTTQLALFFYARWLSVIWLAAGGILAWYCLSRIAEEPAQRKRRRSTTWSPFGSMPSGSSRSSSARSSRSSSWSSRSSSSWSSRSSSSSSRSSSSWSSRSSSSSSRSSGGFSGGGGSFGGGGSSGSW